MLTLLVGLAAGLGALARFTADRWVGGRSSAELPWGTFVVNVSGSFLFGLLTGLAVHHGLGSRTLAVVGSGFAGGYTTLSTWAWETLALAETGDLAPAALNVVGSVGIGLAAAAAGLGLALL
jgi:CrcB protein